MTARMMRILGASGSMLAFLQFSLPDTTPVYVELIVGTLAAGVSYYLGHTNQGTAASPPPLIIQPSDMKV